MTIDDDDDADDAAPRHKPQVATNAPPLGENMAPSGISLPS
jgi:hypothetical protein